MLLDIFREPDDLTETMRMTLASMMLKNYCIAQKKTTKEKLFKPCLAARSLFFFTL
jgi:hypothetical protein